MKQIEKPKALLKDIIDGLVEKKVKCECCGEDWKVNGSKEDKGHNQLCNKEIEIDTDAIFVFILIEKRLMATTESERKGEVDMKTCNIEYLSECYQEEWEQAEAISKAILEGKIIKEV